MPGSESSVARSPPSGSFISAFSFRTFSFGRKATSALTSASGAFSRWAVSDSLMSSRAALRLPSAVRSKGRPRSDCPRLISGKLKLSTATSIGSEELLELLVGACSDASGLRSTSIDPAETRSAWKVPASNESGDQSTAIWLTRA
ncbi:hypothetical protein D3C78_1269870 [compost metagenome]